MKTYEKYLIDEKKKDKLYKCEVCGKKFNREGTSQTVCWSCISDFLKKQKPIKGK